MRVTRGGRVTVTSKVGDVTAPATTRYLKEAVTESSARRNAPGWSVIISLPRHPLPSAICTCAMTGARFPMRRA